MECDESTRRAINAYLESLPQDSDLTLAHMDVVQAILRAARPGHTVATSENCPAFKFVMELSRSCEEE